MEEWSEQEVGRDMWPSFHSMLELGSLKRNYQLQRIHKEVRPTSHIYLATQPGLGGKAPTPELLMRALYLSKICKNSLRQTLTDSLDVALDEIEHALLDPNVSKFGPTIASRIFLHFLGELDMPRAEIEQLFADTVSSHVGHRGSDIIKLYVDQIEVKVHHRTDTGSLPLCLRDFVLFGYVLHFWVANVQRSNIVASFNSSSKAWRFSVSPCPHCMAVSWSPSSCERSPTQSPASPCAGKRLDLRISPSRLQIHRHSWRATRPSAWQPDEQDPPMPMTCQVCCRWPWIWNPVALGGVDVLVTARVN